MKLLLPLAAITAALLCGCKKPVDPKLLENDPAFQIDVLHQESAVPGHIVRATKAGQDLLQYTCKPDDAAVVMFTMRNLANGANVSTKVLSAKDEKGRDYLAEVPSQSDVKVLVIKRGFAEKPRSIAVELGNGNPQSLIKSTIKVTDITEPKREVSPASPEKVAAAEKRIAAFADDSSGQIELRSTLRLGKDMYDRGVFLGLAFSPWDHGERAERGTLRSLPVLYEMCTDWVKVRTDRYKITHQDFTLTCQNVELVQTGSVTTIRVPSRQVVGKIGDQEVTLDPTDVHPGGQNAKNSEVPTQTLTFRCKVDDAVKEGSAPGARRAMTLPISVTSVSPTLGSLGIRRLRVIVVDEHPHRPNSPELAWIFASNPRANASQISKLKELTISGTTSTTVKVGSDTYILPVHHFDTFGQRPHAMGA